ncbi:MAG: ribulose-phosphate 3-epimerase [Bacteroidales bacterium]
MKKHLVAPSILASDFTNLEKEIKLINQSQADWIHIDVMDGNFVPNLTIGFPVISQLKKHATKPLDVHLMILQPERYISKFRQAGADILTVHYEACTHLHRTVHMIKEEGMKAGVAINPHTPVALLEDIVHDLDLILIMTVNPGFGGQKFIEHSYKKVSAAKEMIQKMNLTTLIEVDGGVDEFTTQNLINAGVDVLVAGSFVFNSADPSGRINLLKQLTF